MGGPLAPEWFGARDGRTAMALWGLSGVLRQRTRGGWSCNCGVCEIQASFEPAAIRCFSCGGGPLLLRAPTPSPVRWWASSLLDTRRHVPRPRRF